MSLQSTWTYFIGLPVLELVLIASLIVILVVLGYLGYRMYVIENKFGAIPSSDESETKTVHTTITPRAPSVESPNVAVGLAVSNAVRSIMNETSLDEQQAVQFLSHMLNKMNTTSEVPQDSKLEVEEESVVRPKAQAQEPVVEAHSEINRLGESGVPEVVKKPRIPEPDPVKRDSEQGTIEQEVGTLLMEAQHASQLKQVAATYEGNVLKKQKEVINKVSGLLNSISDLEPTTKKPEPEQARVEIPIDQRESEQKQKADVMLRNKTLEPPRPKSNVLIDHGEKKKKARVKVAETRIPGETEDLEKKQPEAQAEKEEAEQQEKEEKPITFKAGLPL